jgi:tRNA(Ile)-lysidine synthetase-like protein
MLSTQQSGALTKALGRSAMFEPGERVLVAFSGGPDSTALLLGLREAGHDVVAAHFDHALQPGSEMVAAHAARFCGSLGITCMSERRTSPLPKGSVQAAARSLRYAFLELSAEQAGASRIALGHTADDLVEGTVMHLLRGCGIAGLRGMPATRGLFVRPLLGVWRADVLTFLDERGVVALEDPANSNLGYRRVTVRRELLPALELGRPGITRRLHAVAKRAAELQEQVERKAAAAIEAGAVSTSAIRAMSEPVAAETLRALYHRSGGPDPSLGRSHISAMLQLVRGGPGGRGLDLPGGRRFRIVDSRVQVLPRVTHSMEASLQVESCPGCTEPDSVHLRRGLRLRIGFRQPGLRMRPAGGSGTRKLQDIFVDAKVPREERDDWPLVFAGDRLAWVPGVAVDRELQSPPGESALHVTVTRILAAGRPPKEQMLESPDSPRGESS